MNAHLTLPTLELCLAVVIAAAAAAIIIHRGQQQQHVLAGVMGRQQQARHRLDSKQDKKRVNPQQLIMKTHWGACVDNVVLCAIA